MYFSWKSSADLQELKALIRFVREQSFYEYSLSTAVSFPIYGQKTKCNMRFLYIPRPICHENPLIFAATSLLLIQNGKKIRGEKKREREKRERRNSTRKKATKGKNAGEKRTINPFFCCSSSCICEQLSQLLVKLCLTCCQHEFSKT